MNQGNSQNIAIHQNYHHILMYYRAKKLLKSKDGVSCTILYQSVIEAFFNDLVGFYELINKKPAQYFKKNGDLSYLFLTKNEEVRTMELLKNNERESIIKKLNLLKNLKHKDNKNKTENHEKLESQEWFQQLKNLIECRNALVHLKSSPLILDKDTGEISGIKEFLKDHIDQKRIKEPKFLNSWFDSLDTEEYCKWCADTVYNAITEIRKLLPEQESTIFFLENTKLV
ncbi:TPA: hypothetical protein SMP34_000497 [Proteus mirabilis]|nr:hypothetical protein [Proteus mirabilis]